MQKTAQQIRENIIEKLEEEKIIGFIVEEVEDSLDYLNKYKLKNIEDNIDTFIENLKNIQKNYVEALLKV